MASVDPCYRDKNVTTDTVFHWVGSVLPLPLRLCYIIAVASPSSPLLAKQVKLDSQVSFCTCLCVGGEGGLVLLWRVRSGGDDHSELPEEQSHPKVTQLVGFLTGAGGRSGFTLPGPHFERL